MTEPTPELVGRMRESWQINALGEFSAQNGVCGVQWAHGQNDERELVQNLPPDVLILSHHQSRVACPDLRLDGSRIFSGDLAPQTWMIVSSNTGPRAITSGPFQLLHVYLPLKVLQDSFDAYGLHVDVPTLTSFMTGTTRKSSIIATTSRLVEQMARPRETHQMSIDALAGCLISDLAALWMAKPVQSNEVLTAFVQKRVFDFIHETLDQRITLDMLATVAGLSRSHFCRAFRNSTGFTPMQAIEVERMTRARDRISKTQLSITEIAHSLGYNDSSHFSRAFRRCHGVAPNALRKGLRGNARGETQ
ncbi:AraC family transcriptional regulator [Rhodobacteraceae bacterium D3-12]|nr:AraC family transcriptional regulator [Rhodobacteraceae bacterium D3-12]